MVIWAYSQTVWHTVHVHIAQSSCDYVCNYKMYNKLLLKNRLRKILQIKDKYLWKNVNQEWSINFYRWECYAPEKHRRTSCSYALLRSVRTSAWSTVSNNWAAQNSSFSAFLLPAFHSWQWQHNNIYNMYTLNHFHTSLFLYNMFAWIQLWDFIYFCWSDEIWTNYSSRMHTSLSSYGLRNIVSRWNLIL